MAKNVAAAKLNLTHGRRIVFGWPTNSISIDFYEGGEGAANFAEKTTNQKCKPNVILMFIPGNPGLIEWYSKTLVRIVSHLGVGYAARGISYAGHGSGDAILGSSDDHKLSLIDVSEQQQRKMNVPWTIEGQIAHKLAWVDQVIREWKKEFTSSPLQQPEEVPRLIFVSHSFGAYLVQHLLLRRPDILKQTQQIIYLMPFIRFDPPPLQKMILSTLAHSYTHAIPALINCVRGLTFMFPQKFIDIFLNKVVGLDCDEGRKITLEVCTHPRMVRNHLVLGFEEIREIPELPNDIAFRLIQKTCLTSILFCGCPDQWAPLSHLEDLKELLRKSLIDKIHCTYMEDLTHDFVVHPRMIEPVVKFCVDQIKYPKITSKL